MAAIPKIFHDEPNPAESYYQHWRRLMRLCVEHAEAIRKGEPV